MCGNIQCFLFTDGGSSVSLVSSSFVKRIGWEGQVRPCAIKLTSFTQDKIGTSGLVTLPVSIAGRETQHDFIVTELLDTQFLVGLDFMQDKGVIMDYQQGVLRLPDGSTTPLLEKPASVKKSSKMRCAHTIALEPHTVQYLSLHIIFRGLHNLTIILNCKQGSSLTVQ
jgi:hypothetical protein